MSLPTKVQELFIEVWEQDQADESRDILPGDLGHPDWDYAYLNGHDWATIDGVPVFFEN